MRGARLGALVGRLQQWLGDGYRGAPGARGRDEEGDGPRAGPPPSLRPPLPGPRPGTGRYLAPGQALKASSPGCCTLKKRVRMSEVKAGPVASASLGAAATRKARP